MPEELTPAQKAGYLNTHGDHCPKCNSYDISGGSIIIETGDVFQDCECGKCGYGWTDQYKLHDVLPREYHDEMGELRAAALDHRGCP